jgi:DNA-binding Xre family transcriptional regulator
MPEIIATFDDKFGEERVVHRATDGHLRVRRQMKTPGVRMNRIVSHLIGMRIKELRIERNLTLQELATACGMGTGNPKERMWSIENATRNEGVKMGTLYVIALALGVEVAELLPSVSEVALLADVQQVKVAQVA